MLKVLTFKSVSKCNAKAFEKKSEIYKVVMLKSM